MANTKAWFDLEQFAHMTGFHTGMRALEETGHLRWTNTATDIHTGGVHGLRYAVEKDSHDNFDLILQHWVHWPGGEQPAEEKKKKRDPDFLVLKTETRETPEGRVEIAPVKARWMGKWYEDPADIMKLMHLLQKTAEKIHDNIARNTEPTTPYDPSAFTEMQRHARMMMRRDEIPNMYDLTQECGIHMTYSLEGMNYNGEFNFGKPVKSGKPARYPKAILQAMLGIENDVMNHDDKSFNRSVAIADHEKGGYEGASYVYEPLGRDSMVDGFKVSCKLWRTNAEGAREETVLSSVTFKEDLENAAQFQVVDLEFLGYKPDLTAEKGLARALRAIKNINLHIRRNEPPPFSDIIHEHDLKPFLRPLQPPQKDGKDPRTLLQVFGANMDAAFTEREKTIGSNGMVVIRDFEQDGKWVKLGIGVDWGITFGDPKNSFYHSIAHNFGRYTTHASAPHIKPYVETFLNLETHEHEDHLRGVAKLAKFGYNLPPMVMNEHTYNVLKRMMNEEHVKPSRRDKILDNCHVVNVRSDVNPEKPDERKTFEYGDTVLEQYTEVIWSEEKQKNKYFPIIDAYKKDYPETRTKIRIGPAGHSAHALMFDVDGILYTGDYKMDQTIDEGIRTDIDWLRHCKDGAVHVQECTNATKDIPSNPTLEEVKENRKDILRDERSNRILYDTIGSNAIDIEMFCRAAGEVRKEHQEKGVEGPAPYKYVIFAGAAIRNKYSDLNATHNFKSMMRRKYGIETLNISTKTAKDLLQGHNKDSYIVVMSGTQDEPLSVSHRVSRDLHDLIRLKPGDVMIRGQSPIPGDNRHGIRREQNNRYRHDFGCKVYDCVEMAQEGKPIYASSHASQDDVKQVHEETGDLLKMLFHGGPQQIHKMKEHMDGWGARALVPDKQFVYEVDRENKNVSIAAETPEERVGFREIRANPDEFYKKNLQQPHAVRVKDRWHGPVAQEMYNFEKKAAAQKDKRSTHKPTKRGVNLSSEFAAVSGQEDFPLIGIYHPEIDRPYYTTHRNIKLFIGMDTETTGANPAVDVHTDISFVATDPEDGTVKKKESHKHGLRRYTMASVGALGVTKNNDPEALHRGGFKLRKYVYKALQAYKEMAAKVTGDPKARALHFGYRNGVFDDPITMRMLGMGLASNDMKPMSTYGNLQLDVYNLYTAMIALRPDLVGTKQDKDGNYIRTLETACKANGIEYDHDKAHGSMYDAERVSLLLHKLREKDPDIFEQMVMNADYSASRGGPMVEHILGMERHFNDQAPVFGFVDPRDRTCQPRLGALVTIDTENSAATDAIVLDLAQADIHRLEQLSDDGLREIMDDPDGPFSVLKLNNSPCLFPPQMVYSDSKARRAAIGNLPKSTLMKRANALKHLSGDHVGNNLIQRIQRLYPETKLCRWPKNKQRSRDGDFMRKPFRLPNERVFSLFDIMNGVNQTKSRHRKKAAKLLRDLQPTESEFKRAFNREKYWKDALDRVYEISKESGGQDPAIEDLRFLIEWQVHDINPKWLPPMARMEMNALKSVALHGSDKSATMTVERFRRELEELEQDPEQFKRVIGSGEEAKERWKSFKKMCLEYADYIDRDKRYAINDTKREAVREHRRNDGLRR